VVSGKVRLVQESKVAAQSGFLMYLPIYKNGAAHRDVDERRLNITGWVLAPFRMGNLMAGIFGGRSAELDISVFDGVKMSDDTLMHDSRPVAADRRPLFQSVCALELPGRSWTVAVKSTPELEARLDRERPMIIAAAGSGASVLLSLLVGALATGRLRAERLVRKRTAALQEKETQLEMAIEGSGVGLWDWNTLTGELYVSERWAEIIGYSLRELGPLSISVWTKNCHPDDLRKAEEQVGRHFAGKTPFYEVEFRMRHKNGGWVWILARGKVTVRGEDGSPLRMTGTHLDITGRKNAAAELAERTALLENLLNSIPDLIFFKDTAGVYLGCNHAFAGFTGRPRGEIAGKADYDLFPKEMAEEFRKNDRIMMERGEPRHNEEWIDYPDGRKFLVDTLKSPLRSAEGSVIGVLGVARDITERRLSADKLQRHNSLLHILLSVSDELISAPADETEARIQGVARRVAEFMGACRGYVFLFGEDGAAERRVYEWRKAGVPPAGSGLPASPDGPMRWWSEKLASSGTVRLDRLADLPPEAAAERRALESRNVQSLLAAAISDSGQPAGFIGFDLVTGCRPWPEDSVILVKMTAGIISNALSRARRMEELSRAGKNFDMFFNTIGDLLFVMDTGGNIIHVNDTALRRLGYSREEITGRSILMTHPPEKKAETETVLGEITAGKSCVCNIPVMTKSGALITVETRIVKGEWNGETAFFMVTKDVSALKLSEQKFASAFHSVSVLMCIARVRDGCFIDVNGAFLNALGFSRDEVIGKSSLDIGMYANEADRDRLRRMFEDNGEIRGAETLLRKRDGTLMSGLFSAAPIDVEGQKCWLVSMVDITERKKAEEMLRSSEEKFRLLLNSTGEGIYGIDMDGKCTFCNNACLKILGYSNPGELLGKNMHCQIHHHRADGDVFPVEDCRIFQALRESGGAHVDDEVLWRADGSSFPAEYWAYPQLSGGSPVGAVVAFHDITGRKEEERRTKQSLREKETLLREIHHRVKNNMAIVSSLLCLQAETTGSEEAKKVLSESQRRVKSMSLVHEKLYRSKDLAGIDFQDYINTIVMELRSAYAGENKNINVKVSAEGVVLDIDTAIPCGLILNELVTNTLKYAFAGRDSGDLTVTIAKAGNTHTLTVRDNGVGMPPGFDPAKTSSLGLQIVDVLAGQIGGKLEIKPASGGGAETVITFSLKEAKHGEN
jgi:PAS domain S-box-containing protein